MSESGAPILSDAAGSGAVEMTTGTQRAGLRAAATPPAPGSLRQRLRDYVTLTKPRIISLLLVTTLAPMVIAARGWPSGWTILWTMLGGYLMAGGANAINMYIDRDIDRVMLRTSLRPIPSLAMPELRDSPRGCHFPAISAATDSSSRRSCRLGNTSCSPRLWRRSRSRSDAPDPAAPGPSRRPIL